MTDEEPRIILTLILLFILLMYSVTRICSCAEKTIIIGECQKLYPTEVTNEHTNK